MYDHLVVAAAIAMYEAARPGADEDEDGPPPFEDATEEERLAWIASAEAALEVFHHAYRRDKLGETRFLMNSEAAATNMAKANAKLDGKNFDKMPKKERGVALDRARALLAAAKVPPGLRPGQLIGFTTVYANEGGDPELGSTELSATDNVESYADDYLEKMGVAAVYLLIDGPGITDKIN